LGQAQIFSGLCWDNVVSLNKDGLVTFGGHSINHEILTRLPIDLAYREIIDSKTIIEKHDVEPVNHFAYPNGTKNDYNETIKRQTAAAYKSGVTTLEGLNTAGCDFFEIKRLAIGSDCKLWEFKLALAGVFEMTSNLKRTIKDR
jgi:peptidoglycan/xylan/chitin deacetylase (PgdA/CDA1 family)